LQHLQQTLTTLVMGVSGADRVQDGWLSATLVLSLLASSHRKYTYSIVYSTVTTATHLASGDW